MRKEENDKADYDKDYERIFDYFFIGIGLAAIVTLFIGGLTRYLTWTVVFKVVLTGLIIVSAMLLASHKPSLKEHVLFEDQDSLS